MDNIRLTNLKTNQHKSGYTTGLLAALLSFGLCACKDASVHSYTIPKSSAPNEESADAPASKPQVKGEMQALPGMAAFAQSASDISYTKPKTWTEIAPTSIRKANFVIDNETGKAEISITVFPGDVGGLLANVNRWRSQIGLEPLKVDSLGDDLESTVISNHQGYFVKLEGNTQSILGGILPFHGSTWFIKMQGSILSIDAEETNFKDFLSSIKIEDPHH